MSTDTSRMPMHLLHTMTGPLPGKIVPFHDTSRSSPFAGPDYIDMGDFRKDSHGEDVTHRTTVVLPVRAKLADKPLWLTVRLRSRFDSGLVEPFLPLAAEF